VKRILFLARAEILHIVRDRATLAQVLVLPILQLFVLSNAATFEIRDTPTYIVDLDVTGTSRGLVERFGGSGHFRIVGQSPSLDAANEELLRGQVTLVLTIPHDFESSIVRNRRGDVQLSVNAEKGSAAGIVQSYAMQIVNAYAVELGTKFHPAPAVVRADDADQAPLRGVPRIDVEVRHRYNETLNYKHYMVPGLLVALVTMIGTLLSAQNIARE
jgi:ABC-2 type transport system permease protein